MFKKANNLIRRIKWFSRSLDEYIKSEIAFHNDLIGKFNKFSVKTIENAEILEIGHGTIPSQGALMRRKCRNYTGIDVDKCISGFVFFEFKSLMKDKGVKKTVKRYLRDLLFDRKIKRAIAVQAKDKQIFKELDLIFMDARTMSFADDSFDLVFSRAVFEHIDDVGKTVGEVKRILKPGGLAIIEIHLFASLSGGHHLEWQSPETAPDKCLPPWDHIRENKYPVADVYLNKLHLKDYRKIFKEKLQILNEELTTEGESLLNESLEHELGEKGYARQDLITRSVKIIAKKA